MRCSHRYLQFIIMSLCEIQYPTPDLCVSTLAFVKVLMDYSLSVICIIIQKIKLINLASSESYSYLPETEKGKATNYS